MVNIYFRFFTDLDAIASLASLANLFTDFTDLGAIASLVSLGNLFFFFLFFYGTAFHCPENFAVYTEKIGQLLFAVVNYKSDLPAVFNSILTQVTLFFNSYLFASVVYCKPTNINESEFNEPSEKNTEGSEVSNEENEFERALNVQNDRLLDRLFPSADKKAKDENENDTVDENDTDEGSENEFERALNVQNDRLLDRLFPSASKNTVEKWLEGVDVEIGEGSATSTGEETLKPSQERAKGKEQEQEQEQEQMDVDSDGGSDSDFFDFF
jgi:hypothetical protein